MVRAGALYFAIVISFFIAVISASLIMLVAHYRNGCLKEIRYSRLLNNMDSATAYAMADKEGSLDTLRYLNLFGTGNSVGMVKKDWGIYESVSLETHVMQDTLKRAFLLGKSTELDSVVLYLSDEDRPISVSGKTKVTGNALLPKAGVKQSYVEGRPYENDKSIYGWISDSERKLPTLNEAMLKTIKSRLEIDLHKMPVLGSQNLNISFQDSVQIYRISGLVPLRNELSGHIILYSDTAIVISASAKLHDVQIYAPSIQIEKGFKGNCQLFARDSIVVGDDVQLNYPSVLAVLRVKKSINQRKIVLGKNVQLEGILFSEEAVRTSQQTMISLGKDNKVKGEIYCTGLLKLEKGTVVDGKVACNRFIMQTPSTLYENFLVDVYFSRKARSRYYLSAKLFDEAKTQNKILKWLN